MAELEPVKEADAGTYVCQVTFSLSPSGYSLFVFMLINVCQGSQSLFMFISMIMSGLVLTLFMAIIHHKPLFCNYGDRYSDHSGGFVMV